MQMSKSEMQNALANIKTIYVVGYRKGFSHHSLGDRYQWRKFFLFYILKDKLLRLEPSIETIVPCWMPVHKTRLGNWIGGYWITEEKGVDRPKFIVRSLGHWLFDVSEQFKTEFLSEREVK